MARFGRKTTWLDIFFSKITLGVLIVLCIFIAISVFKRYQVERDMAARLEGISEEKTELEERQQVLKEKVEYLQGESGIESEIRKHFDVAKEGEQVVIIVDKEEEIDREDATLQPNSVTEKPWYRFW